MVPEKEKNLRIDSSNIGMESARSYRTSNVTVRRFMITDYQTGLTNGDGMQKGNSLNTAVSGEEEQAKEQKEQTEQTGQKTTTALEEWQNRFGIPSARRTIRSDSNSVMNDIRQVTLRYIFDMLFAARRNRLSDWMQENGWSSSEFNGASGMGSWQNSQTENAAGTNVQAGQTVSGLQGQLLQSNGMVLTVQMKSLSYTMESCQTETEDTSFSTVGTVHTKDRRAIHYTVQVGIRSENNQYYNENLQLATFQMCDPLVINLDTDVAELSDQNFYFDIDADGETDEIAGLSGKSGYLALDKNEDGVINDGSELFGTASGNGFADLAKYDEDGNGWIDEGDAIWSKLKIWCKNEKGEDVLYRLADKGVGAICLQNAATDFTLKGGDGGTKGAIRNTGVFLYENGNVGTIQHVDLVKRT